MKVGVKVCGITRGEDARLAAQLGAARIGLVFWPGSPRRVDAHAARDIVAALPEDVRAVGVFVDATPDEVKRIVRIVGLSAVQLHGDEAVGDFGDVGAEVIKAVAVGPAFDPDSLAAIPPGATVLLDAHDPVRRGGTGRTIDWTVAARIARERPTILSGGLTAENVMEAILHVRPHMVDVSSGVESAPGVKDPGKLRRFFACIP